MADGPKLVRGASKIADLGDRLGQRFATDLSRVLRQLERRVRPIVVDASDGSRTAIIRAGIANRTRKALETALSDSGYEDLATSAYGARLDNLVEAVLSNRGLAGKAAKLTGAFDERVAAIKALHATDLLDVGDEMAKELWQSVTRGVFGARDPQDILADLGDIVDATEPQIQTLYDTGVSIVGRQVEALQAGADPETRFAFMGPVDAKTRDWCLEHVGRVYTRDEIDQMDNGQIDNVFLTGGGYNCRHTWIEIAKSSELYNLGNGRVPEVSAQLDALEEAA
jgi:hypothetical protein